MRKRPILSLFMRGVMLDPSRGSAQHIDTTDREDCTTSAGHARLRVLRGAVASDRARHDA